MNIKRIFDHFFVTQWSVRKAFSSRTLTAIEKAIKTSEANHVGQIRFAVEGALEPLQLLKGQSPAERAIEVFSNLRVWDTQHNNGLLIYVLFADRAVEIVADRGIHAKVGSQEWTKICREMEVEFRQSRFEAGALHGIRKVEEHLAAHFPGGSAGSVNELPDKALVL